MYLMYVDESGDCGSIAGGSPTRYFILSGLVLHELRWKDTVEQILCFRKRMSEFFGLRLREEIHASHWLSRKVRDIKHIPKHSRLSILRHFIHEISLLKDITIINVVVDKQNKPATTDVFELAWRALLQRLENTIRLRNFPGPSNPDEKGQLFPDGVDNKKLRLLVRKMRRYNPIPHNKNTHGDGYRMLPLDKIIEDPNFRNSADSYLIQVVDTAAYFLKQHEEPSQWMKKKGGHLYFKRLEPVLCKHATSKDPLGIVRI